MPGKPPPKTPKTTLPAFTPVPRQRMRRGGWSAERQREFIEQLAETGSVRAACRRMGVGEHHIYKLRRHPEGESFRKAWEAALDCGIQKIEDIAMDRALHGLEQPVYHNGAIVGTRMVYNDRLLMFMLRNRAPERFAADSRNAHGKTGLTKAKKRRLKRKWKAKWEKEWGKRQLRREVTTIASINAKIDKMREKSEKLESPRVRAARQALQDAEAADREEGYSPWRDPDHELYRGPLPNEPEGVVSFGWTGKEDGDEDAAGDEDADGGGAEERKGPRVRRLKDDGWH